MKMKDSVLGGVVILQKGYEKHSIDFNISCYKCGMEFLTLRELEGHQLGTHDTPGYCSICDKRFQSLPGYVGHRKIHESSVGNITDLPKCHICGKVCQKKSHLEAHMRSHFSLKPFVCQHCGKSYKHRHHLSRHMNESHPGQ